MIKTCAPILLFVYNRPEHTRKAVESLLQNPEAMYSDLYIYSDGSKNVESDRQVNEVRKYVHEITGFARVTIVERDSNWGLARNIIDGVTAQVGLYGRVIVVEDDLVLSPYFLRFMNEALELYKDEMRIGHIQACDFTQDETLPDTFLIKWTGSWGWATWDRAWKYFNPDGSALLEELEKRNLSLTFDFGGAYGYTRMLRKQVSGKNNSWAIRWNASLFLADILSLNVGRSLVANEGFDGSGTHCGSDKLYTSVLSERPLEVKRICPVEENLYARNVYATYYRRTNSLYMKGIRRLKRLLRGDFSI